MSVRRLAEDTVQPVSFAFNKANAAWAKATIKKYPKGREQSAVIPLLMRAQEQDGWVTKAAIESVADMLGMPYIRVLEVATFYTQFQLKPVGTRAHVQVCGTTPCMLRGAEDLINVCKGKIASEPFALNESGTLSWEEVECQGACVNAPMVMIFKDTFEDLTPERLEQIIDSFEAGKGTEVTPGPQIDRVYSAPIGGPTTLLTRDPATKNNPAPANAALANPGRAKKAPSEPAVSIPPANAARAKTASAVTNPTLKTPVTAKKEAAAIAKIEGETVDKSKPAVAGRPSLEDKNRPAGIEKPVAIDDLKLISGVGPKIEATLHEIGIYTFAQVASWTKAEREWVDGYLNFKGRIERDDWVKQAKALAKGGEAEYIKVFGKKPR